jgi:hypothetical protein
MSEEVEEVSLQDEVRAAFKDSSAKEENVSNEDVIDKLEGKKAPKEDKPKDEVTEDKPKDKPKQKDEVEDAETVQAETETEEVKPDKEGENVTLKDDKAPSSWAPNIREKWKDLPADVRAEVIRREEASAMGVRKLHEEYQPIKNFAESLSPFIQEAVNNGANPAQYISNVMASERGLRNPDPQQRFNVLLNIAEQYGIPLRDIINQSAGQEILQKQAAPQIPQELTQQFQRQEAMLREMQEANFKREIDAFSADKEFFSDVSNIMADLMDSNRAKDLADAYEQACWVHPDVRKVLIERERVGTKNDTLRKKQAAASGASVRSSGAADVEVEEDGDGSIESEVRKAMKEVSGRV